MRALWVVVAIVSSLPAGAQTREDPRVISIHPFTGQRGTTFVATVRGSGLTGAKAVSIGKAPFTIIVEGITPEPAGESSNNKKAPLELVKLRVEVPQDA